MHLKWLRRMVLFVGNVKKILRKSGLEVMIMQDVLTVLNKVRWKSYCLNRFRDRFKSRSNYLNNK